MVLPTNTSDCSHRVWSSNGWEWCSGWHVTWHHYASDLLSSVARKAGLSCISHCPVSLFHILLSSQTKTAVILWFTCTTRVFSVISWFSAAPDVDSQGRRWLDVNRIKFIHDLPALDIIMDHLVVRGVFDPRKDDYQEIVSERTPQDQTRELLSSLRHKGDDAILQFQEVLQQAFPHVFDTCFDPGESIYLWSSLRCVNDFLSFQLLSLWVNVLFDWVVHFWT